MFFDETKKTLSFFLSFFFLVYISGQGGGKKTAWGNIITDKMIYPNEC